jgi:hypothetical protein
MGAGAKGAAGMGMAGTIGPPGSTSVLSIEAAGLGVSTSVRDRAVRHRRLNGAKNEHARDLHGDVVVPLELASPRARRMQDQVLVTGDGAGDLVGIRQIAEPVAHQDEDVALGVWKCGIAQPTSVSAHAERPRDLVSLGGRRPARA